MAWRKAASFTATVAEAEEGNSGGWWTGEPDWCFLPLYVFCGEQRLVSSRRPRHIDAAKHAPAIRKLLVTRLRAAWPGACASSCAATLSFCRWKMRRWCERHGVDDLVGLAKNPRLLALTGDAMQSAATQFEGTQEKQRRFGWLDDAADTWDRARRVIAKAEPSAQGANPRFVVTSLAGDPGELYDGVYCARGEMEPSGTR